MTLHVGDAVGAAGDRAGTGVVRWSGTGPVPIAAMHGRITAIGDVSLLTRHRPRRALVRRLRELLAETDGLRGVIVEGPLRRRLVRPAPGLLFTSDRLFRVTGPLWSLHADAAIEGVYASFLPIGDRRSRELAAGLLARRYHVTHPDLRGYARYGAWTPGIDALLSNGQLPFAHEVLGTPWPTDPMDPHLLAPPGVIAERVERAAGDGARDRLAEALQLGATPEAAAAWAGIPASWVTAGAGREDLRLTVVPGSATIERTDGPAEPVALRLDGEDRWLSLPRGAARVTVPTDARRVVLDPYRLSNQDRRDDEWPPRWKLTATGWLDSINLSSGYAELGGWAGARRTDAPQWTIAGSIWTGRQDLVGTSLGVTRLVGAKTTEITRAHRLSAWIEPAWLNSRYYETGPVPLALGAGVGWTWDTRVEPVFPLEGHRISIVADGGAAAHGETWAALRGSIVGLWAPVPRLTLAGRATGGVARGEVQQRLLALGGGDQLRSVAPEDAFGVRRWTAAGELRAVVLRNLGVNLGLAWLDDVQLSAGAEAGQVDAVTAYGATAGIGLAGDLLGIDREIFSVLAAVPVAGPTRQPQVYVQWGQAF